MIGKNNIMEMRVRVVNLNADEQVLYVVARLRRAPAFTFADIASMSARCRFRDCTHAAEPGCAIQASLDDGSLEYERWQSYQKL